MSSLPIYQYPPTNNGSVFELSFSTLPNATFNNGSKNQYTVGTSDRVNFYTWKDVAWSFFSNVASGATNTPRILPSTTQAFAIDIAANVHLIARVNTQGNGLEVFITDDITGDAADFTKSAENITSFKFGTATVNTNIDKYELSIAGGVLTIAGIVFAPTLTFAFNWQTSSSTVGSDTSNDSAIYRVSYFGTLTTKTMMNQSAGLDIVDVSGVITFVDGSDNTVGTAAIYSLNYAPDTPTLYPKTNALSQSDPLVFLGYVGTTNTFQITMGSAINPLDQKSLAFVVIDFPTIPFPAFNAFTAWSATVFEGLVQNFSSMLQLGTSSFQKFVKFSANSTVKNYKFSVSADLQITWAANLWLEEILLGVDGNVKMNGTPVNWEIANYLSPARVAAENADFNMVIVLNLFSLFSNTYIGQLKILRTGTAPVGIVTFMPSANKGIISNTLTIKKWTESALTNVVNNTDQPNINRGIGGNTAVFGSGNNSTMDILFVVFSVLVVAIFLIILILLIVALAKASKWEGKKTMMKKETN